MKNNIDISSSISLYNLRYNLIESLSHKELVDFFLSFEGSMSDSDEFVALLAKKVNRLAKRYKIRQ